MTKENPETLIWPIPFLAEVIYKTPLFSFLHIVLKIDTWSFCFLKSFLAFGAIHKRRTTHDWKEEGFPNIGDCRRGQGSFSNCVQTHFSRRSLMNKCILFEWFRKNLLEFWNRYDKKVRKYLCRRRKLRTLIRPAS